MPQKNPGIVALAIKVILKTNPSFDVQAGDKPATPGKLDFFCSGGESPEDASFLKEILQKVIAAYPNNPISLCIDKPAIVPDAQCAGAGLTAAASGTAPKAARRKAPAGSRAAKGATARSAGRRKARKKRG